MKLSELPIINAIAEQTLSRYDNASSYADGNISLETYNKYKKSFNASLAHGAIATSVVSSTLTSKSFVQNNGLSIEAMSALTSPDVIIMAGVATVGIAAYLNSHLGKSDYLVAQRQMQEKLTDKFGVKFNLGDFNDEPISNNILKSSIFGKVLSSFPRVGADKFRKGINMSISMGVKSNIGYMKNILGEKFCKTLVKSGNKIGLTLSSMEEKGDFFKDMVREYQGDYKKKIGLFIGELFEDDDDTNKIIEDKYNNEYNRTRLNKENYFKEELYKINRDAIKFGYETVLIQNTQLAFVNCLKRYCKERINISDGNGKFNGKQEKLNKLREQLNEFKSLYDSTKSNNEEIIEYKMFDKILDNNNFFDLKNIDMIKEIEKESFGETTSRINKNLSDGGLINVMTLKSAIEFHKEKILKNESNDFRINYENAKKRKAIVSVDYAELDSILTKTTKITEESKDNSSKYKKIKI